VTPGRYLFSISAIVNFTSCPAVTLVPAGITCGPQQPVTSESDTITVLGQISLTGPCPTPAQAGVAIPSILLTASGGVAPYTLASFTVTNSSGQAQTWLTPGIAVGNQLPSSNTLALNGTPPAPGLYTIVAHARDSVGSPEQTFYTCTITVQG